MKQNIINARVTFRKSPIHVLEKFAFKDMPNACLTFKKNSSVSECVIIQTCNRIELFATSDNHSVDKNGVAIRSGHHCAQVLMEKLEVAATNRASFYIYTTKHEVDALIDSLEQVAKVFKL